jgi:hypothetical protein
MGASTLAESRDLLANIRLDSERANAAINGGPVCGLSTTRREPAWGALELSLRAKACWHEFRTERRRAALLLVDFWEKVS